MRQRNSAGEGHHPLSLLLKLSPLPNSLPTINFPFVHTLKMSSIARAFRPFASRVITQKPLASVCQASPAFRFPRGTRSFSQSPLCECPKSPVLCDALQCALQSDLTSIEASYCLKHASRSSMMSHFTNSAPIRNYSPAEEIHRVARMD